MQKKGQTTSSVRILEVEKDRSRQNVRQQNFNTKEQIKNYCPECNNQVFFLEAGFLCPTCGYSMETLYS